MASSLDELHRAIFGQPLVVAPGAKSLTLHEDERLIGMAMIYPTQRPELVTVYDFGIHPRYQRQGYGRKLLRQLFNWCLIQGKTQLYLNIVEDDQADARTRFYTTTYLRERGNLVYQGTRSEKISDFVWQDGRYVDPRISQHKRFYHRYLGKLTKPKTWVSSPVGPVPIF